MPRKRELYVKRYEYKRTRGWTVRIERQRVVYANKLFSDAKYGGSEAARAAALAHRDALLATLPPVVHGGSERSPDWPGPGYVRRQWRSYRDRDTDEPVRYEAYIGWIRMDDGRVRATNYGIKKWGRELAEKMAKQWLTAMRRKRSALRRAVSSFTVAK